MYRLATDNYYDGLVNLVCPEKAPEIQFNLLIKIVISITSNKKSSHGQHSNATTVKMPCKNTYRTGMEISILYQGSSHLSDTAVYRLFYTTSVLLFGSKSSIRPVRSSVCSGLVVLIAIGGRSLILISFLNKSAMFFCKVIEQQAQKGFHKTVYNAIVNKLSHWQAC